MSVAALALAILARRILERPAPIPPPAPGERDTTVDGVRWRSRELAGTGSETVVYVHGFLCSSATWQRVLGPASGGRAAIAVDLPGSGYSDRPWPYDYTVGGAASGLLRFLEVREIRRAVLVGNSLGAAVCLVAAAARPERISALVLSASPFPGSFIPIGFRGLRAPLLGELQLELLTRPVLEYTLKHRLYARSDHVSEKTVDDWWDPVRVPGTRRAALQAIRTSPRGLEGLFDRITAPTLILWGKEDRLLPPEDGLKLARKIRNARLVLLPDAGHLPEEETPGEFSRAVAAFLSATTRG
jgi:pimeloyl-ACP methyl ester carboxylesterase